MVEDKVGLPSRVSGEVGGVVAAELAASAEAIVLVAMMSDCSGIFLGCALCDRCRHPFVACGIAVTKVQMISLQLARKRKEWLREML